MAVHPMDYAPIGWTTGGYNMKVAEMRMVLPIKSTVHLRTFCRVSSPIVGVHKRCAMTGQETLRECYPGSN